MQPGLEIVQMEIEFLMDDFGRLYILSIDHIWVREKNDQPCDHSAMLKDFLVKEEQREISLQQQVIERQSTLIKQ